jgi:hypothetical protein
VWSNRRWISSTIGAKVSVRSEAASGAGIRKVVSAQPRNRRRLGSRWHRG